MVRDEGRLLDLLSVGPILGCYVLELVESGHCTDWPDDTRHVIHVLRASAFCFWIEVRASLKFDFHL